MSYKPSRPWMAEPFNSWWTLSEWCRDNRTGALAVLKERPRRPSDRPGKSPQVWHWVLVQQNGKRIEGHAQDKGGARRAVRKIARELPDKEEP